MMNQLAASDLVTRRHRGVGRGARRGRLQLRRLPLRAGRYPLPEPGHRRLRDVPRRTSTNSGGWSSAHPHVIGDFTWTGWDYLGEAGIGRVDYTDDGGLRAERHRRAATRSSSPTSATSTSPATAGRCPTTVRRLRPAAHALHRRASSAGPRPADRRRRRGRGRTPCRAGRWDVPAGAPVTVDVYSDAEEVELLLNGRSLGTAIASGPRSRSSPASRPPTSPASWWPSPASPAASRRAARSAHGDGAAPPVAASDPNAIRADDTDLAYVAISCRTTDGNLATDQDRDVSVTVAGPGILAGLGTGRPQTEEPSSRRTAPPTTAARSPSSDRCGRAPSRSRSAPTATTSRTVTVQAEPPAQTEGR